MGFTLIETMLFLAITGLMVAGMLVGSGVAINSQRYNDSVSSLQSELQDQFSQVQNTSNGNSQKVTCTSSGISYSAGGTEAGASPNCYILGRYITGNGTTLKETSVVGYVAPADEPTGAVGDITALQKYSLKTTDTINLDSDTYTPDWNATFTSGKTATAFSLLIIRSPTSGAIRTFINPSSAISETNLASLLTAANLANPLNLCVVPNGTSLTSGKLDVQVAANSSSTEGVSTLGDAAAGNPCN